MARLSPLSTGCGSCDEGISQRLVTAWAKVLACLCDVWVRDFGESVVFVSSRRHFQWMMEGVLLFLVVACLRVALGCLDVDGSLPGFDGESESSMRHGQLTMFGFMVIG